MRDRGHWAGLLLATSVSAWSSSVEATETVVHSYDSLGRLIRVEHSGSVNSGVDARYAYDTADNRTHVTVAGVPTVTGGSFETPDMSTGYAYRPSGSPVAYSGNSGVAGNGSVWGFASAPDGDQVAFLQSAGAASTIALPVTGLSPATRYTVRFRIAVRPGHGANPVTVAFGGIALGTFTPGSAAFSAVTSAAFTASAGSGTLTFTGSGSAADLGTGIDLVTVAAVGSN